MSNKNSNLKQTTINSFFTVKTEPKKPIIEETFDDSFFDDVDLEQEADINSLPAISQQPISASQQSGSASVSVSSSTSSSQASINGPSTPSKLKLPISFTSKSNNSTPTKPTPSKASSAKSNFSLVINDDEEDNIDTNTNNNNNNNNQQDTKQEPLFKSNINTNNKTNDLFARFSNEKSNFIQSTSKPAAAASKKRKEMDFDDNEDEDNTNNENDSQNANILEELNEFSFRNGKKSQATASSQKVTSPIKSHTTTTTTTATASKVTPTPKTPTKSAARKPVVTYDSESEEEEEDDSKSKSSKAKGNAFGKKDKKDLEERYSFLVDIKDANGNPKDHPDYDKRTLYIPAKNLSKFSPFERQFWDIKSKNYDTVVFFKKGKFYELYESDADIGHQQLDLKMTDRINMRMVGVPESSFGTWASKLIQLGYKVAKVDQMETSIAMNKRQNEKGGRGKKDSIIQRELVSILTAGTLLDDNMIGDHASTYLMAIKENEYDREYGVCFVDVSIGEFHLCSFQDDENRMQFETLLLQMMPKEVIYEKGATSPKTMSIMKRVLSSVKPIMNARLTLEYWDPVDTMNRIAEYCGGKAPESLKDMKNESLLMGALGGCVSYLVDIKIGQAVVEQGRFKRFNPLDVGNSLILDGQCLVNLEIFNNSTDGSTEGTLFKLMDRCSTSFGKRLFRQWICRPLANKRNIEDRQKAIEYLRDNPETMQKISEILTKQPDLERMIARIRSKSSKINDLIMVLERFESIHHKLLTLAEEAESIESIHLKSCILMDTSNSNSNFDDQEDDEEIEDVNLHHSGYPNLLPYIERVRKSFTVENERVVPSKGLFEEFDICLENIENLEAQFGNHLEDQRKSFKCNKIDYKHMGKEIYQIEIPVAFCKKLPAGFELKSASKAVNRYHTPFVKQNLSRLLEERDTFEALSKDVLKKIQSNFTVYFNHFQKAIQRLSQLDCILSLYKVSFQSLMPMCRPVFKTSSNSMNDDQQQQQQGDLNSIIADNNQCGFINVVEMMHPCIYSKAGDDFIPNDIGLNTESNVPSVMVLTGPNMGGKSTLLRQTCILVIMAQMGCYVSATSCEMSVVDRIFTRLGANDNILAGQSTFMVELAETCSVLKYATKRSLVILDELGRGTSTFDGYSIAFSVLRYIASQLKSMCIFATHYQSLAFEPTIRDSISTGYMTCHVDDDIKRVIFLYKLVSGVCPNSYGLHVASMAGLSREIIQRAEEKSKQMERDSVLVSSVHGTIHRSKMVEKIVDSFKLKDLNQLIILSNTLKDLDIKK